MHLLELCWHRVNAVHADSNVNNCVGGDYLGTRGLCRCRWPNCPTIRRTELLLRRPQSYMTLQLKGLKLTSGVVQSPMAACTDLAFRLIAREKGLEFAFLEMVSAHALVLGNDKT